MKTERNHYQRKQLIHIFDDLQKWYIIEYSFAKIRKKVESSKLSALFLKTLC